VRPDKQKHGHIDDIQHVAGKAPISPLPEQETLLLKSDSESKGNWTVWTHTHADSDPEFKAEVYLSLCGTEGSSVPVPLREEEEDELASRSPNKIVKQPKSTSPVSLFTPGSVDEFKVTLYQALFVLSFNASCFIDQGRVYRQHYENSPAVGSQWSSHCIVA
jgi:hypothetical protein